MIMNGNFYMRTYHSIANAPGPTGEKTANPSTPCTCSMPKAQPQKENPLAFKIEMAATLCINMNCAKKKSTKHALHWGVRNGEKLSA